MSDLSRSEQEALARRLEDAGWGVVPPEQHQAAWDPSFQNFWDQVRDTTLISPERGWALAEAVRYVIRNNVPGDVAECGVWRGGACLLASLVMAEEETEPERTIWLYDTFTGMTAPGSEDRIASSGQDLADRNPEGWWAAGVEEVRRTLERSPLDQRRFRFVPGPVERTLAETRPERLAVLRLDTDWYESTMAELEQLYPVLSPGGVLIIDDYGHFTGARTAVDRYFARRNESPLLHRSDYTGRVLVKPGNASR